MKNSIIKSIKQLPEWFKLENYRKAEFFNAAEWFDELMSRFALKQGIERFLNDSIGMSRRWELITRDGLLFYSTQRENICHTVFFATPNTIILRTANIKEKETALTSVSSLTNIDAYSSFLDLKEKEQFQVRRKLNNIYTAGQDVNLMLLAMQDREWAHQPFEGFADDVELGLGLENKIAYAKVKLFGSDEQIKKDFAIWLEEERKRRNAYAPKKNFSENAIDGWHEFSILQYLDLSYWAKLENVKISQHWDKQFFPMLIAYILTSIHLTS